MSRVMIQPADYETCRQAVDRIFEIFQVDISGKNVLVKPNAVLASHPDEAVVTHPALIRALVEKLEAERAGQIIVGDNPGLMGYGANEQTFRATGLMEASKGYYRNIGAEAVEAVLDWDGGCRISVSKAVMDADVFSDGNVLGVAFGIAPPEIVLCRVHGLRVQFNSLPVWKHDGDGKLTPL